MLNAAFLLSPKACSAGLKNTVPADCCERKILFWQDVNSDSVREKTSQPAGNKPAEHAEKSTVLSSCAQASKPCGVLAFFWVYLFHYQPIQE